MEHNTACHGSCQSGTTLIDYKILDHTDGDMLSIINMNKLALSEIKVQIM